MKRPGARWKHTTGEAVLQMRALQLSDRWALAVQRAIWARVSDAVGATVRARIATAQASALKR